MLLSVQTLFYVLDLLRCDDQLRERETEKDARRVFRDGRIRIWRRKSDPLQLYVLTRNIEIIYSDRTTHVTFLKGCIEFYAHSVVDTSNHCKSSQVSIGQNWMRMYFAVRYIAVPLVTTFVSGVAVLWSHSSIGKNLKKRENKKGETERKRRK